MDPFGDHPCGTGGQFHLSRTLRFSP
jgi:hypothetical protein